MRTMVQSLLGLLAIASLLPVSAAQAKLQCVVRFDCLSYDTHSDVSTVDPSSPESSVLDLAPDLVKLEGTYKDVSPILDTEGKPTLDQQGKPIEIAQVVSHAVAYDASGVAYKWDVLLEDYYSDLSTRPTSDLIARKQKVLGAAMKECEEVKQVLAQTYLACEAEASKP
jgi:hypothetical protein